jgi:hypothetical protein
VIYFLPAFFRFGYPQPLVFPVDERPHCVGTFLRDYMHLCGIQAGLAAHKFGCKIRKDKDKSFFALPRVCVSVRTMWNDGKKVIASIGLDPSRFASHSAKRGGALAAAQAGLNDVELTRVGNWSSPDMAALYLRGTEEYRTKLIDAFRT